MNLSKCLFRPNSKSTSAFVGSGLLLTMLLVALSAQANPGDLVASVNLPVLGFGVSVGVDCEGTLYYTQGDQNLYKMDKLGNLLATIPITDAATGAALTMDEMAWDNGRKVFWAQQHGSNPVEVYQLDPTTGLATHAFTSATNSLGSFRDGIAYDSSDDSLWISGDVSTTIEHYRACDGGLINQITPKNSAGTNLGTISGLTVGVGDLLYLGRNGLTQIVQVKKSDGSFIGSFASPGGARDEGLECDAVNFAPTLVLWSRDVNNFLVAIELEPGTCTCQSACPEDIAVCSDPGECGAVVTYEPGAQNTTCDPPSGSFFPLGNTLGTCTTANPACPDIPPSTCTFTVAVNDCEPPLLECPDPIEVCNDADQCSAIVEYNVTATDNCPGGVLECDPASGSVFPEGTTVVTCEAVDAAGNTAACDFTGTVDDCDEPTVACVPTTNPAGDHVPNAGDGQGSNANSGKNPDGFYELLANDNCEPADGSEIWIKDSSEGPCGGAFAAGPYPSGTTVKLTQSPGKNAVKPMAGVIAAHINTKGEPVMVVTDPSGNTACSLCFVPPPPK